MNRDTKFFMGVRIGVIISVLSASCLFSMEKQKEKAEKEEKVRVCFLAKNIPEIVSAGNVDCIKMLIKKTNSNDVYGKEGKTALHYACSAPEPNAQMLEYLMSIGANLEAKDMYGFTPLDYLFKNQNLKPDLLKEFLKTAFAKTTHILNKVLVLKDTLAWVSFEVVNVAKSLSESFLYERDEFGRGPLEIACIYKDFNFIKFLLQFIDKKYLFAPNKNKFIKQTGETPFHLVCRYQGYEVISLFLQQEEVGRKINLRTKKGFTPLLFACRFQKDARSIQLLLEKGAHVKIKTARGDTVLHEVCSNPHVTIEMITLLLDHNADPNAVNKVGKTVLQVALEHDKIDLPLLSVLVNRMNKKTINKISEKGSTPLVYACRHKGLGVIQLLMEHGASESIKSKDSLGRTPLHLALIYQDKEVVKYLLDNGAMDTIYEKDIYEKSPIHYIQEKIDTYEDIWVLILLRLLDLDFTYKSLVELFTESLIKKGGEDPSAFYDFLKNLTDQRKEALKSIMMKNKDILESGEE